MDLHLAGLPGQSAAREEPSEMPKIGVACEGLQSWISRRQRGPGGALANHADVVEETITR